MDKSLEDLEKSFILDADMEHEDIKNLINRIQSFCQVDKNGFVKIDDKIAKKLNILDRVLLVLTARHLANKLQLKLGKEATIKEEMISQEVAEILKEKQLVINARLKDLKDDKQIVSIERGTYKVAPYSILNFLNKLEGLKND